MILKKLITIIVLVLFSASPSNSWAQMNAVIVWDEIKQIASANGYKISALISQSEKCATTILQHRGDC